MKLDIILNSYYKPVWIVRQIYLTSLQIYSCSNRISLGVARKVKTPGTFLTEMSNNGEQQNCMKENENTRMITKEGNVRFWKDQKIWIQIAIVGVQMYVFFLTIMYVHILLQYGFIVRKCL